MIKKHLNSVAVFAFAVNHQAASAWPADTHKASEREYLAHVVDAGAGGEQQARDVLVAALRRDPQRRGAVGARRVHARAARQQRAAHLLVPVLRRDEQRARLVLPHQRVSTRGRTYISRETRASTCIDRLDRSDTVASKSE